MPSNYTLHVLSLTLGVLTLAMTALGLYGLTRRRPFVIEARWMLAVALVAILPQVVLQLSLFFGAGQHSSERPMLLIVALISIVLIPYLALMTRGYMVYGTTESSFRDALVSALSSLHLEFEETLSSVRLPSVPAELQVAVQGWIGIGELRLKQGGPPGLLADVAGGMNAHFNAAKVKTNMISAVAFVILGLLGSAMVVTLMLLGR
jgi:hypothetical protein